MKIALAHDWLTNNGGAESVVSIISDIYKKAPIYTTIYNDKAMNGLFSNKDIRTSFLQNFKGALYNHQKYFPFMPIVWEQFNFNKFDVVISSSTSCSKGIITSPDTLHICYCNTPMRYAWEFYHEYLEEWKLSRLKKTLLPYIMNYIRTWDAVSANRVDYFVANSKNVARRIYKHYKRHADVIYPPVLSKFFNETSIDDEFFLVVSRLVPYKKVDLAVKTFNELRLPLIVIGDGPQLHYLRSIANDNVKILGRQPDSVVMEHYSKCRALVFPGEEDFGLTPIEVQASGRPVIAFEKGGATETVIGEKTGLFFKEQTIDSLKGAILKFDKVHFNKNEIINHASSFSEDIFRKKIRKYVNEKYDEFTRNNKLLGKIY